MDFTNYSDKTISELKQICKDNSIKGYSGKKKSEIIELLTNHIKENKKNKGQFYTTNSDYILEGLSLPNNINIIEPFAGKGDLIKWANKHLTNPNITAYDIDPKHPSVIKRDTLKNPPDYKNAWIITNPPFLARNKSDVKEIYDIYNTNDLYKCFIHSFVKSSDVLGGILIIPSGFFFSNRDLDVKCRNDFMTNYRINKIRYFEETVFDDTTTTIVAFSFEKSDKFLKSQEVEWESMPSRDKKIFVMDSDNNWIIGGDIYNIPIPDSIKIRRHVEAQDLKENEQQTFMTLNALDSGTKDGRISLNYKKDYIYPAKDCSRTYATLRISGLKLSEESQIEICKKFNKYIEEQRTKTWSLFLPQFRESKEYARKRIPFELAYRIVSNIILQMFY